MLTRNELYEMYVVRKMTTTQIAESCGCLSTTTISNWLKKSSIPVRQGREAQQPKEPSREQLIDLYEKQNKSIDDIAKKLGSSEISVRKLLLQHGIKIRQKAWKLGGHNKGKPLPEWQCKVLSEFAKQRTGAKHPRFGTTLSRETKDKISNKLKGRFRGSLNPQWKPDATHKWRAMIHGQSEYKEWRRMVFQRDKYTCMSCLKPSTGDIQSHHILPVESHPHLVFDSHNGITLCRRCHRSIKGKEMLFVDLFNEIIETRLPNL